MTSLDTLIVFKLEKFSFSSQIFEKVFDLHLKITIRGRCSFVKNNLRIIKKLEYYKNTNEDGRL